MSRICSINGILYMVTLPTGRNNCINQWDLMVNYLNYQTKELDDIIHWKNMFSWCQEREEGLCSIRGYSSASLWYNYWFNHRGRSVGFRPVFIPLDPNTLQPDPAILDELNNGQTISLGSFYFDNKIMHVPQDPTKDGDIPNYTPGTDISFRSLKSGYGFQVIKLPGILIADRVLVKNISWEDLKNLAYIDLAAAE